MSGLGGLQMDASQVLGAMLTPAVLISACGSLVMSTSSRLSRVVDRFRQLAGEVESSDLELGERRDLVRRQFDLLTERALLLRSALTRLYVSIGFLALTSLGFALIAVAGRKWPWLPVASAIVGAGALLHASWLLIREAKLAVDANLAEIHFARRRVTALDERPKGSSDGTLGNRQHADGLGRFGGVGIALTRLLAAAAVATSSRHAFGASGRNSTRSGGESSRCIIAIESGSGPSKGGRPQSRWKIENAEGVQIRPAVHRIAAHLFGRHVRRGADGVAGLGQSGAAVERPGDSEVEDLDSARGEEDVLRLEVAVHHPHGVGLGQRAGDLLGDLAHLAERQPDALTKVEVEALALDDLHGDVELSGEATEIVDPHQPGMSQATGDLDLAPQAGLIGRFLAGETPP